MKLSITHDSGRPNSAQIHVDVAASAMTDKSIEYCLWDKEITNGRDAEDLHVIFTNSLIQADKDILDTIVTNNT